MYSAARSHPDTATSAVRRTLPLSQAACTWLPAALQRSDDIFTSSLLRQEKVETFRRGQQEVGEALLRAAAPVLAPEAAPHLQYGGANADFGLRLADTMVEWGQKHLVSLEPPRRNAYLQQATPTMLRVSP